MSNRGNILLTNHQVNANQNCGMHHLAPCDSYGQRTEDRHAGADVQKGSLRPLLVEAPAGNQYGVSSESCVIQWYQLWTYRRNDVPLWGRAVYSPLHTLHIFHSSSET